MTIIKKFEPEEKDSKFPKKYIAIAFSCLFILTIIEIWASNTVASFGDRFERLSNLENNLKMENQILKNEIAKKASLPIIASKSAELGFSTSQSIEYIR